MKRFSNRSAKKRNAQKSMHLGCLASQTRWTLRQVQPTNIDGPGDGEIFKSIDFEKHTSKKTQKSVDLGQPKSMDLGLRKCSTHKYGGAMKKTTRKNQWTLGVKQAKIDEPWASSKPKSMDLGCLANQNRWTLSI